MKEIFNSYIDVFWMSLPHQRPRVVKIDVPQVKEEEIDSPQSIGSPIRQTSPPHNPPPKLPLGFEGSPFVPPFTETSQTLSQEILPPPILLVATSLMYPMIT